MSRFLLPLGLLLILGAFLWVVSVFSMLGFYAYPSADDFCMVSGVEQNGLFAHLWQHYFEWSGRYSGNAFYAIYPLFFGFFHGYPLIAPILIFLLFSSTVFFLSRLFNLSVWSPPIWLVALGFVSLYLIGLRHTASSLYWMAGALSYQTANILLLYTLGLLIRLQDLQKQQASIVPVFLWLAMVVVLGMGTNETNMVTLIGVLLLALILKAASGWSGMKPLLGLVLIGLICFAVVYFSPGNDLRESTFPYRHDWMRSLQGSWNMGSWSLLVWSWSPVFIVSSLLAPLGVLWLAHKSGRQFQVTWGVIILLLLITFAAPFVLQFPAWWSMGGWPPPRTVDAIFFVYLLSWILTLGALTLRFIPASLVFNRQGKMSGKSGFIVLLLGLLLIVALNIDIHFKRAQQDLSNRAEPFEIYMQDRHAKILEAKEHNQMLVTVPSFQGEFPRSIFFNDIRTDGRDWRNRCYAQQFEIDGIALDAPHNRKPK